MTDSVNDRKSDRGNERLRHSLLDTKQQLFT